MPTESRLTLTQLTACPSIAFLIIIIINIITVLTWCPILMIHPCGTFVALKVCVTRLHIQGFIYVAFWISKFVHAWSCDLATADGFKSVFSELSNLFLNDIFGQSQRDLFVADPLTNNAPSAFVHLPRETRPSEMSMSFSALVRF